MTSIGTEQESTDRERRKRGFPWILYGVVAILAVLYFAIGLPLKSARRQWNAGNKWQAIKTLERWERLQLRPADYSQMLSGFYLATGKPDQARPHLARISGAAPTWFPPMPKEEILHGLVAAGRYQELLEYDTAVRHRNESDEVVLYRAAAEAGLGRLQEAESTFATVDEDDVDHDKYITLRAALQRRREGGYPMIVDRTGRTIAEYRTNSRDLVAVNAQLASLVEATAGKTTFESNLDVTGTANVMETTIDPAIQAAGVAAMQGHRGGLVAIDPKTGEILAVVSETGALPLNLAFESHREPGSIIKVLTGLTATRSNAANIFPLKCDGFLIIDGRQFFDWAPHGEVASMDAALATSCNVAFAKMGMAAGAPALQATMRAAGFGHDVSLGHTLVHLGDIVGDPATQFDVANLSIGLEHERVTPLHVALLASMMANRGRWSDPVLIRNRRTILGEVVPERNSRATRQVVDEATAARLVQAMRAVVESPHGTGRRAAIDGLTLAMKTGTAGERDPGYDSVIMAFAPADDPKIAVGIIAENAGPAELTGARIVRQFLTAALGKE